MIEYKAVAMDLDDTLLTSDLQISEETKQTLLQCQKDGMHVILASGRPIYAIEKYAKELELEKYGGYIVGFNGAAVRDCKAKRMIMQRNLPMEYIKMAATWTRAVTVINLLDEFQEIVLKIVTNTVIPVLPVFIATTFCTLAYEGTITKQLPVFIQVVVIVMVGHYIWLAMLYLIAGAYAGRNPLEVLKHYGAAYITAVGTMSSAATLAVALRCARKSKVLRNDMIDFGIPLFANIHLCGSVLTETFFVMVVSKILYGDIPDMKMMVLFCILLGIFAIGAPGVPGGTVMASLGLITGILGFNETGTALILTVFALQDSFGTACNITGDGALTLILTGYANRHGISEKTVKNSDC